MAEKAYLTDRYGNRISDTPVLAEAVTPEMRNKYRYKCCGQCTYGIHKGAPCTAEMTYVSASRQAPSHFREVPGAKHIRGCEYDESGKTRTKTIEFIDRAGKGQTPEGMLRMLLAENKNRRDDGGGGAGPHGPNHRADEDEAAMGETNVLRRTKQATRLQELLYVLQDKKLGDPYGSLTVNDWLIDNRNVLAYRENGIRSGQPIIVICSKTIIPEYIAREKGDVVLRDAYRCAANKEPMYFVIQNTDQKFRDIIFKSNKKQFAVFGQWRPMAGQNNVYITYYLGQRAIFALKDGEAWTAE